MQVSSVLKMGALAVGALIVVTIPAGAEDIAAPAEFQRYCAICHGADGRGVGVMTEGENTRKAADLTQIAKRNNGNFPFSKVAAIIWRGGEIAEHKSKLMPSWGAFYGDQIDPIFAKAMVFDLTQYVETLQEK
jgi:mono/diheme cytochrome c family protein